MRDLWPALLIAAFIAGALFVHMRKPVDVVVVDCTPPTPTPHMVRPVYGEGQPIAI